MRMRVLIVGLMALMLLGGLAPAASAAPNGKNCWGVVTSQLAQLEALGTHSSEQSEPRAGLGNLSRAMGYDHISELGSALAMIDGKDTGCPQP